MSIDNGKRTRINAFLYECIGDGFAKANRAYSTKPQQLKTTVAL